MYGIFTAFAAAFILLSVKELVVGVWGLRAEPIPENNPADRACVEAVRELERALERGVAATAGARNKTEALEKMRAALAPEWDGEPAAAAACAKAPHGAEAWAELLRLRRTEEGVAAKRAVVIAPLRRELARFVVPFADPASRP